MSMLLMLLALFFVVLALRELLGGLRSDRRGGIYVPYLLLVTGLAIACAWLPVRTWRFERFLEDRAVLLTDGKPVSVHCNSVIDTLFDPNVMFAGHANPETGEVVFQKPWCGHLRDFLDDPQGADEREIASLNLFTHEAMHIRGEMNEARTECQAVQRNYRAAKLLGVPDAAAKAAAQRYYTELYARRNISGSFAASYYSDDCAPGRAMDERLPDSSWAP
jgi:hypothetical protein